MITVATTWTTLPRLNSGPSAWYQSGDGQPLVFVHGVGLCAESWHAQILEFGQSCRVYALDMPGHGGSARIEHDEPNFAAYLQRLYQFIHAEVGEPVILVGHSMGAMLAIALAIKHSALCRGFAALNAVYRRAPAAADAVQARAAQLKRNDGIDRTSAPVLRWFGDNPSGDLKDHASQCQSWLQQADRQGYADAYQVFASEDGPASQALQQLQMPAVFLTGALDNNSKPSMSEAMAALAPEGEARIIAGAGHMMQMTHPQAVNEVLSELISHCENTQQARGGTGNAI